MTEAPILSPEKFETFTSFAHAWKAKLHASTSFAQYFKVLEQMEIALRGYLKQDTNIRLVASPCKPQAVGNRMESKITLTLYESSAFVTSQAGLQVMRLLDELALPLSQALYREDGSSSVPIGRRYQGEFLFMMVSGLASVVLKITAARKSVADEVASAYLRARTDTELDTVCSEKIKKVGQLLEKEASLEAQLRAIKAQRESLQTDVNTFLNTQHAAHFYRDSLRYEQLIALESQVPYPRFLQTPVDKAIEGL